MIIVVSDKKMKCLFLFGLCIAVVLSVPIDDSNDDHDDQHNQNRRRLQTLSLKLIDGNDAQKNNVDRDDDDNNDDRRNNDDIGALRELVRESYDVDGPQVTPKNAYTNDAKNSHLDLLAKELERLSAKYQGKGVLKVAYSPSKTRNANPRVYDLGSLHFKYVAPQVSPPQHYQTFNNKIFQHFGDREAYHYNGDKHPYHYYSDRYDYPYVNKPEFPYAYPSNYVHGYLRDRPDDDDDDDNNNNNNN